MGDNINRNTAYYQVRNGAPYYRAGNETHPSGTEAPSLTKSELPTLGAKEDNIRAPYSAGRQVQETQTKGAYEEIDVVSELREQVKRDVFEIANNLFKKYL